MPTKKAKASVSRKTVPEKRLETKTVFVIPHTHWDREWYGTFQQFRVRLVHVLDALLDLLERDPGYTHFNLDGQTVVLNDYLEIRPENRERLQAFIRQGRLGVGPWYVMPDEFLVSGEALVRNLLLGHKLAEDFGHVQKVGYLPDTFGHISQMPQILTLFGIPYAMHFRGLDEGQLRSELWWCSPDGSRVLLRHLPTDMGYANASALPENKDEAAEDLVCLARYETRRASGNALLALNGVDHLPARPDLPAILQAADQAACGEFSFRQTSLEEYFAFLSKGLKDQDLQSVTGELREANRTAGRDNRLLPHVLSSRINLKQQNERAETLLERWAEPWSALAWLEGAEYPQVFLWKAWEWLLQNHAHDSIGGCSLDAVHAQMETRFAWASEIAETILQERFELFARQIDLSDLKEDEAALVVFNSLPFPLEAAITVDIDLWDFFVKRVALLRWEKGGVKNGKSPQAEFPEIFLQRVRQYWYDDPPILPQVGFRGLRVRPLGSDESLPVQVESVQRASMLRPFVSGPAAERRGDRARVSFFGNLPACGYQVYAVSPLDAPNKVEVTAKPHNLLENEFLRIQINPNGTFDLQDRKSGAIFRGLGYFEDGSDCGDGYNYSNAAEERLDNSLGCATRISRLAAGPAVQRTRIEYDWSLPARLDGTRRKRVEERIPCPLSVILSLAEGTPRLDMQVEFDNRVQDHRLRMVFPSDVRTDRSCASAAYDVVEHPIRVVPVPASAWVEDAPTTFPEQDWVDLSDGQRGLGLISRGLPEYEVLDTERREIALTLLRAVGFLGAGPELQTAFIGAGPNIATPEAEIQRKLTFHLALLPHTGKWDQAEVWRQALAFNNPPRAYTTGMLKGQTLFTRAGKPPNRSLLTVEGVNVLLSALKRAEWEEALILRLYNPSEVGTEAKITLPFDPRRVTLVGLDERTEQPPECLADSISVSGSRIRVTLPAKKIVTLKIELSP